MSWLAGWTHRKTVSITGQTGAGTNYQVDFSIGDGSGGDFHLESNCTSFPNDIQVTDNDQTTPLDYWVKDLTVDPITMWVEVADDLGSNVDICVYYGKSGESSASNGDNTFVFFDHFPGTSYDTNKWMVPSGWVAPAVSSSIATFHRASGSGDFISTKVKYMTYGRRVEALMKYPGGTNTRGGYLCTVGNNPLDASDLIYLHTYSSNSVTDFTCRNEDNDTADNYSEQFPTSYEQMAISLLSSEGKAWRDGVNKATVTTNVPDEDLYMGLREWESGYSGYLYVDWVFIREYNDPEPAFSSAGSEVQRPSSYGFIFG